MNVSYEGTKIWRNLRITLIIYLTFFIGFQRLLGRSAQVLKSVERKHLDYSIANINHPQSHLKEKPLQTQIEERPEFRWCFND